MPGIKIAFGGGALGGALPSKGFESVDELKGLFNALEEEQVSIIDTARLYGESEKMLGDAGASSRFIIDTKHVGGFLGAGGSSREKIVAAAQDSLQRLSTKQVDIYYLHSPDAGTPLEETCAGINDVYKTGAFKRFGLSNYFAKDVQEIYDICKKNDYVLPTVYQGNYSPVARRQEELLFPTLRKLGISFYAYSPMAGGFLAKTKEQVLEGAGRFDSSTGVGKMYSGLYSKPKMLAILVEWDNIAKDEGCSRADLAYRWVRYNSSLKEQHGDAIIIGASSMDQLTQTLKGVKAGPLSAGALKRIDAIWESIKDEAPLDNVNG